MKKGLTLGSVTTKVAQCTKLLNQAHRLHYAAMAGDKVDIHKILDHDQIKYAAEKRLLTKEEINVKSTQCETTTIPRKDSEISTELCMKKKKSTEFKVLPHCTLSDGNGTV